MAAAHVHIEPLREQPHPDEHWETTRDVIIRVGKHHFSFGGERTEDSAKRAAREEWCLLVKERAVAREELGEFARSYSRMPDYDEQYAEPYLRLKELQRDIRTLGRRTRAATQRALEIDLREARRLGLKAEAARLARLLARRRRGPRKRAYGRVAAVQPMSREVS